MALRFTPEAADRLRALVASENAYERAVLDAVKHVLRRLDNHPELHRVGANQFATSPSAPPIWARTIVVDDGASWLIAWTLTDTPEVAIRILRIEPAPSLG